MVFRCVSMTIVQVYFTHNSDYKKQSISDYAIFNCFQPTPLTDKSGFQLPALPELNLFTPNSGSMKPLMLSRHAISGAGDTYSPPPPSLSSTSSSFSGASVSYWTSQGLQASNFYFNAKGIYKMNQLWIILFILGKQRWKQDSKKPTLVYEYIP